MSKAQVRVVGAVPARPTVPPSETMKRSLARAEERVRAIKSAAKSRTARAS